MSDDKREVIVTDIRMPFVSMVVLMVKWALASIPAVIILFFIFGILGALFGGVFHGGLGRMA